MRVQDKTKEQPKGKLMPKRQRITELEKLNTENEQAEKVLRESEGQYRDLLEDANDLIQSVAPDNHFLYVNRTWQKVLGYSNEDIANLTLWDIIHPDFRYHCREAFQKVLLGETINNIEAVFVAKDGKLVPVEGNVNCRFVDGKPFATRGIFRDITERKQAERALRESEEKFRVITGSARDAIVMINDEGKISYWNKAAEEMFGYSAEYASGKEMDALIMPERYRQAYRSGLTTFKTTGQAVVIGKTVELPAVRRDGTEFPMAISLAAVTLGDRRHAIAIARDITERKQAVDKLRESERRYRLLAENAGDVIWTVDMNMRPTYISPSMTRLLGYSVEEATAKTMEEVFTPASYEVAMKVLAEELATEKMEQKDLFRSRVLELALKRKDGSIVPVEIGYSFLCDADAQPTGILAIARDITERKQAGVRIEHLNQLLHAVFNVSEFIAKETDPDRLIKGVCDALIKARGYHHVWVTLLDKSGGLIAAAEAGLGEEFLLVVKQWKSGRLPACAQKALRHSEVTATRDMASSCTDCPLADKYGSGSALSVRLEHEGRVYGLLSICTNSLYAEDEEELSLLMRIAGDIAFALYSIELENQRRRAVDSLVEMTKLL